MMTPPRFIDNSAKDKIMGIVYLGLFFAGFFLIIYFAGFFAELFKSWLPDRGILTTAFSGLGAVCGDVLILIVAIIILAIKFRLFDKEE